jgi:hypothetical protein
MPRPTNCLTSGLLPRLGDGADLPHHAKGVVVRPIFCDLAAGETLEREGPHRHPLAPGGGAHQFALVGPISYPPGAHLLAFGYLLLNGEVKIGEDITVPGDELLQALRTSGFLGNVGIVDNEVGGDYLLRCVQVTLGEEFFVETT